MKHLQPAAPWLRLHLPNRIERILQLPKETDCTKQQCTNPDNSGDDTGRWPGCGIRYEILNGFATLLPNQALNLPDDLATRRLLAKDEASNGDDDDKQGSDRK